MTVQDIFRNICEDLTEKDQWRLIYRLRAWLLSTSDDNMRKYGLECWGGDMHGTPLPPLEEQ